MESPTTTDIKDRVLRNLQSRCWLLLDYVSFFLFIFFVVTSALLLDYAIVQVVGWVLSDSIEKYPIVKKVYDWFEIGSAYLTIIGAFVFAFYSAKGQIRFIRKPMDLEE